MTDALIGLIWGLSFGLYLVIYTFWIPLKTQQRIETWLLSEESDETLVLAMDPITTKIREQMLIDYEEFISYILPITVLLINIHVFLEL